MITPKIKALFQFIEFLHSNIENFKQYDEVINELNILKKEWSKLEQDKNFVEKLKYDQLKAKIEKKFLIINKNINEPIQAKAKELNLYDFNNIKALWGSSDIYHLKENFSEDDLPDILHHIDKYIEFRTGTDYMNIQYFFRNELDKDLKKLCDFFNEDKKNEFEVFETKTIPVNSIQETVEQFQKGNRKVSLPMDFLNPSKVQQNNNETLPPQPIKANESRTKQVITENFETMDKKGYEYAFMTEQDYNTFTDILTNFFEYKEYNLPKAPIQLKRGCKTKLAAILGKIHSELSNVDKFSSDTDYFNIVKTLSHYSNLPNDQLYKALTRMRKDY